MQRPAIATLHNQGNVNMNELCWPMLGLHPQLFSVCSFPLPQETPMVSDVEVLDLLYVTSLNVIYSWV